ncbi:MAG TPA: SufD family Fe-S cluster assembly protein, partial [Bacteroidales bacterium]
MNTTETTNIFPALFQENKKQLLSSSPDFVAKMREEAMQLFIEKGFPGKKDENYKYTFLEPFFKNGYKKYLSPKPIDFNINHIFQCDVPSLDTHIVILLNGFYFDKQNPLRSLPGNIVVGSLAEALKKYPELISKHLGKYSSTNDSFVAINTAMAMDGIFLHVPKGTILEKPIQIINVLLSDEELMVQHRNLFIIEPESEIKVVVCDHTLSPQKFLTNSVSEIFVGENAKFDSFKVQNEHNDSVQISHTFINQSAASNVQSSVVTLHGGLVRNNLNVKMNGEGCENHAYGLF